MIQDKIFQIDVSYSQIAVFDPSLDNPFNEWTQKHVDQGFSWRPGSVSFRTLSDDGQFDIKCVLTMRNEPLSSVAIRIIQVPFIVPESGTVEIASISDSKLVNIKPGRYALRYEGYLDKKIRLLFMKDDSEVFSVLRADNDLKPTEPLLVTASPG